MPAEYITKDSKAGLRACLREEFTDVWCLDLRGGPSSRDDPLRDMMVLISVRNPRKAGHSVHYARISRRYSGRDKLDQIKKAGVDRGHRRLEGGARRPAAPLGAPAGRVMPNAVGGAPPYILHENRTGLSPRRADGWGASPGGPAGI